MDRFKILSVILFTGCIAACSSNQAPKAAPDNANNPNQNVSSVVTNSVFFAFNNTEIANKYNKLLTINAGYLIAHPASMIQIQGNSSEIGTKEYNQALGLARAKNVKAFLVKLGVPARQISLISYGNTRLLYSSGGNGEQPKNQRTDIIYTAAPPYQYKLQKIPYIDTATMY